MLQILTFRIGLERYGLELAQVQEVVEEPVLHYLPTAPDVLPGALNLHGIVVAVVDLARLLGIESDRTDNRMVVVDPNFAAVALQVSKLEGATRIEPESRIGGDDALMPEGISARYDHADGVINLLDVPAVMESLSRTTDITGG